jgi:hypothetical protein
MVSSKSVDPESDIQTPWAKTLRPVDEILDFRQCEIELGATLSR